jgi:tRNA(Ile)-lysidine synthase
MYYRFLKYINEQQLFSKSDKLILGVSGGIDSVVLAHLIEKAGFPFAIAHCNFNLRGNESDGDQDFVAQLAQKLEVKLYSNSFHTQNYAAQYGISIEMAARELRYHWFEKLCIENGYRYIVVGHHLDDVLETFMLNLSRGTGIRGLSGIKAKAGKVVRPLLFASRNEIEEFARQNEIGYRNDSSNNDTLIKRNKVRHSIMPLFEELNPSFKTNLHKTISHLHQTEQVFLSIVNERKTQIVNDEAQWIKLSLDEVTKLRPLTLWLFELLRDYGFNAETVEEIEKAIENPTGQQFFSTEFRLVVDRNDLIIVSKEQNNEERVFYIDKDQYELTTPISLSFTSEQYHKNYAIPSQSNIATLDISLLQFPLLLRKWHKGEYFKPLGMSGYKKLSDFFIDEKVSIPEKESTWILASGNDIVWVLGKRIDDRFKLTPATTVVLKVEWNKENDEQERTL